MQNPSHPTPSGALSARPGASRGHSGAQPDPASLGVARDEVIRHGACGRWWTGRDRNHCGSCHETISSVTGFDAHQKDGKCVSPGAVGMVAREEPWGELWVYPGDSAALARRKASK